MRAPQVGPWWSDDRGMIVGDPMIELVIAAGLACVALSRVMAVATPDGAMIEAVQAPPLGRLLARDLTLLQPWLAVAPVCWAVAAALIDDPHLHDVALALGALPVVGALAAFGAALLRTGLHLAQEADEDDAPALPFVLATLGAVPAGLAVGLIARGLGYLLA